MDLSSGSASSYDEIGGSTRLKPGRYHVLITDAEEGTEKDPDKVVVTFEAMTGTVESCQGHRHVEKFATSEKATPRLVRLAMCVGLLKPGEQKSVDFVDAIGLNLVIEVEMGNEFEARETDPATGKKKMMSLPQVTYGGMWRPDHADVKDVPKSDRIPKPEELKKEKERRKSEESGGDWNDVV